MNYLSRCLIVLALASLLFGLTLQPATAGTLLRSGQPNMQPVGLSSSAAGENALSASQADVHARLLPAMPAVSTPLQPQAPQVCDALRILLVFSDNNYAPNTLRNQILSETGVSVVDFFNGQYSVPALGYLQQYDEVVLVSNTAWANTVALGDVIASYQDSGGIVVVTNLAWLPTGNWYLAGRYSSGGYSPFSNGTGYFSMAGLGSYSSGEPLMQGVTSLNALYRITLGLTSGATQVASYTDGRLLAAYKTVNGHTGVAINAYLGDYSGNWYGQWGKMIVNAARWLVACNKTLTVNGTGSGTVTGAGINCTITNGATSGDCTETVTKGTSLDLFANATPGYTFSSWSGGLSGSVNPTSVTLDADKTIGANFVEICSLLPAYHILIVYTDSGIQTNSLRVQILNEPRFAAVDFFNAQSGTPTLAQLEQYEGILVYSNNIFFEPAVMGDVLADYQDGGGVVITAGFIWRGGAFAPQGRWALGGYNPFSGIAGDVYSQAGLGTSLPGHPLMQGISSLTAYFRSSSSLSSGAIQVAAFTDGLPLVVTKTINSHTGIAINAYLGDAYGGVGGGEWGRLIANAVKWAGPCGKILTITGAGSGTVTGPGISCTIADGSASGDCTETLAKNTLLSLTAAFAPGYTFSSWTGGATGSANPTTVTMDLDKTVGASFNEICYSLVTQVDPPSGGTVIASAPTCASDPAKYRLDSTLTLTATHSAGYIFTGWSGDIQDSANPISMTINADASVTGNFLPLQAGPTFIVNTLLDDAGDSACTVSHCTLREAMALAEATSGANSIHFNVDGTITLTDSLPALSDSAGTTIDAETHPITLDGTGTYRILSVTPGATLNLDYLTLTHGNAVRGGAVQNQGILTIQDSLLINNQAGEGGAVYNQGQITLHNTTFASNTATTGGGIYHDGGTAIITNSTFSGNSAAPASGGALFSAGTSVIQLKNTIITNSITGGNCIGTMTDGGGNLTWGDNSCPGAQADPLLAPLADYGGSTQTFALLPGSAAIDAGNDSACTASDQRSISRPQGTHCDSGAFESQGFSLSAAGGDHQSAGINTGFADPLSVSIIPLYPVEPVIGGQILFTSPASGASALLSLSPVDISNSSTASVTATANHIAGVYTVYASASGAGSIFFSLENINHAPTGIALSNASVPENKPSSFSIGTFSTTDPDNGDAFTYALAVGTGDTDNSSFSLTGNELCTAASFDFEARFSYSIRIRATDNGGQWIEEEFPIQVTNVNEAPSVALANTTSSLPEDTDTSSAIQVADIQLTDDSLGTNVLSLSGADSALFEIAGLELRLKAGTALDFETNPILEVTVAVDDSTLGSGADSTAALEIAVTDVDEIAPTILSITRINDNPTDAESVDFLVTFSEEVTGVNLSDFTLTINGVTGASIVQLGGSGATYTVCVDTGSGDGTIRLDALTSATITDPGGNTLANLPFVSGESYTVKKLHWLYIPMISRFNS